MQVTFDDGRIVRYDVMDDICTIPSFKDLETVHGLFQNANWTRAAPASIGTVR